MHVQYTPKGQAPQSWEFIPDDVFEDEAELVEKHFGGSWSDFLDGVREGAARARKVLLWHVMRQDHPKLRFDDTPRFRMGELTAEFSSAELREIAAKFARIDRTGLSDEDVAQLDATAARLQVELTDALLREDADLGGDVDVAALDAGLGKADSNS